MGLNAMVLVFRMLNFKPAFHSPLSSSSRGFLITLHFLPFVVSSAYLRLLIFLLIILIPASDWFNLVLFEVYSFFFSKCLLSSQHLAIGVYMNYVSIGMFTCLFGLRFQRIQLRNVKEWNTKWWREGVWELIHFEAGIDNVQYHLFKLLLSTSRPFSCPHLPPSYHHFLSQSKLWTGVFHFLYAFFVSIDLDHTWRINKQIKKIKPWTTKKQEDRA